MHEFKKLTVWNSAIDFVTEIYKVTETFLRGEVNGITNQIK